MDPKAGNASTKRTSSTSSVGHVAYVYRYAPRTPIANAAPTMPPPIAAVSPENRTSRSPSRVARETTVLPTRNPMPKPKAVRIHATICCRGPGSPCVSEDEMTRVQKPERLPPTRPENTDMERVFPLRELLGEQVARRQAQVYPLLDGP